MSIIFVKNLTLIYNTRMRRHIKTLLLGILAGASIGLGGLLFTLVSNAGYKAVASACFSIGLLLVCLYGLNLFTGKVGFTLEAENKPSYLLDLLIMYVGNIIGSVVFGYLTLVVFKSNSSVMATIESVAGARSINADNWLSIFVGAIGCGALVYTAVYGFKKDWSMGAKILVLIFSVFAFVYCGFHHCIANMFYISFANLWNGATLLNILIVTIGNIIGALILETFSVLIKKTLNNEKGL